MSKRIVVYVSATPDLESEREVIGEALARFPVPLAWEIRRTPHRGEQGLTALEAVGDSDFFFLLLGQDVAAPIGAELGAAESHRLPLLALVKETAHTPAGRFFRVTSIDKWETFADSQALRLLVLRYLTRAIAENPIAYALTPDELTKLQEYLRQPEKDRAAATKDAVTGGQPAGAQEGAVIVSERETR